MSYIGSKRSSSLVSATGITLDGAKLKSSGNSITKSDGTTAVLSESGGVVTLNNGTIGSGVDFSGIANDAISGDKIHGGTISGVTLSSPTINTPTFANDAISGDKIHGGTISGVTLSSPTINTPTFANDAISGDKIHGGTISGVTLSSPTINTPTFANDAISGDKIHGGTISSSALATTVTMSANHPAVKTALNASGNPPVYACRAWVNFNGTGTMAIRASGNVSSLTDNGTGDYNVNFATAMPDANFSAQATAGSSENSNGARSILATVSLYSASTVRVITVNSGNYSYTDPKLVNVGIFR